MEALGELVRNPSVQRIAGFQSRECPTALRLLSLTRAAGSLHNYAPRIHSLLKELQDDMETSPLAAGFDFEKNFDNSVYPTITFNLGPQTATVPHLDGANLAACWCMITALGRFDPDRGGHLILWDLGLIIRFPPGSTIAIPSALMTHSNTPVSDGEERLSITQWLSGHLCRFVHNDFKTDKELQATPELWEGVKSCRWGFSAWMTFFSTIHEFATSRSGPASAPALAPEAHVRRRRKLTVYEADFFAPVKRRLAALFFPVAGSADSYQRWLPSSAVYAFRALAGSTAAPDGALCFLLRVSHGHAPAPYTNAPPLTSIRCT